LFTKILIANRNEIAVRVIRACKEMGIATVAVFSEADREALHVKLADESYCIGSALPKNSYLNMENIISVALATKSEAIHPGYGFLSENPRFAAMCEENNITFIGPTADVISKMGDKDMARQTMKEAGFPVIPGTEVVEDVDEALTFADIIGFPLLIKARAGGGGKGIRRVDDRESFESAFLAAKQESTAAFGDGAVYLEKYLAPVKHIEMQVLADHFGNVVCLGERDCSMQRMNQKLIEESPAVSVPDVNRKRMIDAAVSASIAVGYRGAGTIECLYDQNGDFYFMEMNTRLQVEHPVTESITGVDLVKWQIRIAAGLKLGFTQEELRYNGHSIECRINAESPYNNFRPSAGKIEMLHTPGGPWVRFDTAIYHGYTVPPFYDSMVGKLIVTANTRDESIRKMKASLCELIIEGIDHNGEFQLDLLSQEAFENGSYTTDYVTKMLSKGR